MNVTAFIVCYNEEMILPFVLDYYSKYCKEIILLDNHSTDDTLSIANKYGKVTVIKWGQNEINDFNLKWVKSALPYNMQDSIQTDWVISCDCDEILYGLETLNSIPVGSIPTVEGYQMMSESFLEPGKPITQLKMGFRDKDFDKQVIYPKGSKIDFGYGSHSCNLQPNFKSELKLLHYKYLGRDYINFKNARSASRLSQFNIMNGFGTHYLQTEDQTNKHFDHWMPKLEKVI